MEFIADNGGDKVAMENIIYYIFYIIIIIIIFVHSIYVYFISLQLNLAPSHGKLRAESTLTFLSIQELI